MTRKDVSVALEREKLIAALGLEYMGVVGAQHAMSDTSSVERWHWPRANSKARYDRTVLFTIHYDGSWSVALQAEQDSGKGYTLEDCLRAMVR